MSCNGFYISTVVRDKNEEPIMTKEKTIRRFLRKSVTVPSIQTGTKYFLLCPFSMQPQLYNPIIKLIVKKDEYDKIIIGHEVSVHIKMEVEYACLHLATQKEPDKIIEGNAK